MFAAILREQRDATFRVKIFNVFCYPADVASAGSAEASQYFADDTYSCLNATKKIEKEYQIKKHLLTTISSVETGRWNEKEQQSLGLALDNQCPRQGTIFQNQS